MELDFIEGLFVPATLRSGELLQRAGDPVRHAAFVAKGCYEAREGVRELDRTNGQCVPVWCEGNVDGRAGGRGESLLTPTPTIWARLATSIRGTSPAFDAVADSPSVATLLAPKSEEGLSIGGNDPLRADGPNSGAVRTAVLRHGWINDESERKRSHVGAGRNGKSGFFKMDLGFHMAWGWLPMHGDTYVCGR
jgi:hypothetical protein